MPSGPGWFWRAGEHHERLVRRGPRRRCPAMPSGPTVISGSSALSGTKTVPPLLTVWSTPWSKNWPKNVNSELYGGERPTSVVTFGMNSVLCDGTQPAGTPSTGGVAVGSGSVVHGHDALVALGADREPGRGDRRRVGRGLVDDQVADRRAAGSRRRCPSSACSDDGPGGPKPGGTASASRKFGVVSRGNDLVGGGEGLAAREQVVARPVDRAQTVGGQPVRDLVGGRECRPAVPQRVRLADQRRRVALGDLDLLEDERQIAGVTVKPWPVGGVAALARSAGPRRPRRPRPRR